MGTWSYKPFGNDVASDWAWGLVGSEGVGHVEQTLEEASTASRSLDASLAEAVIAAAAVVAAAASEPVKGVPSDIKRWILEIGYVPRPDTLGRASKLLKLILSESELRDTWLDSGSATGWENSVNRVLKQLDRRSDLPTRHAKKPGMPRLLYKLVERYKQDRDPAVLAKIRSKLDATADPNVASRDTDLRAPLELTLEAGLVDESRQLIERGADLNAKIGPCSTFPLTAAVRSSDVEVVRLLVDSGVELVVEEYSYAADKSFKSHRGLTAAACEGTPEMLDLLVERGEDLFAESLNGETLLFFAAHYGNTPVVKYLLNKGFDPNSAGDYHTPPLFQATEAGHLDTAEVLLQAGASATLKNHWGSTAMDCAGSNKKMKSLLRRYTQSHT